MEIYSTNQTLHVMIGLPRSGKSTFAETLGFPIVCPDSIRLAVHGQAFIKEAESIVWMIAHKMVEALFFSGHTDVILDATNVSHERRKEWLSRNWGVKYYFVNTPLSVCIERALDNDQPELVPVIHRLATKLDIAERKGLVYEEIYYEP